MTQRFRKTSTSFAALSVGAALMTLYGHRIAPDPLQNDLLSDLGLREELDHHVSQRARFLPKLARNSDRAERRPWRTICAMWTKSATELRAVSRHARRQTVRATHSAAVGPRTPQ
jgi:hypothetical protein